MTVQVYLGCRTAFGDAAQDLVPGDRATIEGKMRTEISIPDGKPFAEMLTVITDPRGVWASHSPDAAPAWVASTHPGLAAALAEHYGCPVRKPLPKGERGEFAARIGGAA